MEELKIKHFKCKDTKAVKKADQQRHNVPLSPLCSRQLNRLYYMQCYYNNFSMSFSILKGAVVGS